MNVFYISISVHKTNRHYYFLLYSFFTWKTVCILSENVSKLDLDTRPLAIHPCWTWRDGNFPPNSWDPRSAKIPRNKKSRTSRDTIASILFVRETNRFCNFLQYLFRFSCGKNENRRDYWASGVLYLRKTQYFRQRYCNKTYFDIRNYYLSPFYLILGV